MTHYPSTLPPPDLDRFIRTWARARKNRNVARMEALIQVRYLNYWWHLAHSGNGPLASCAFHVVERILTAQGWLRAAPERPSERAMRIVEERLNAKVKEASAWLKEVAPEHHAKLSNA